MVMFVTYTSTRTCELSTPTIPFVNSTAMVLVTVTTDEVNVTRACEMPSALLRMAKHRLGAPMTRLNLIRDNM